MAVADVGAITGPAGRVAAGFEPVADAFAGALRQVGKGGAALAVVRDGHRLVDLWGGFASPARPWTAGTRAVLMSATKGVAVVAVQLLAERGALDVERPVAAYWPEFAQAGKGEITVRALLSHVAGLVELPGHAGLLSWDGDGWDEWETITGRLAAAEPVWPPGSAMGYHALTFGWLIAELVRRVDGRPLDRFVREEVSAPLSLELRVGAPAHEQHDIARVWGPGPIDPAARPQAAALADPESPAARAYLAGPDGTVLDHVERFINSPRVLATPLAGSTGIGTAKALAGLYGVLAAGGRLPGGGALLSSRLVDAFAEEQASGIDLVMCQEARWGMGYQLALARDDAPDGFGPNPRTFGHRGFGGQIGFADRDAGVGVAFLRNHLAWENRAGIEVVEALYACL